MPCYLTVSNASVSPLEVTCEDGSPHLTREVRKRAGTILDWVGRELQTNCPEYVDVLCKVELKNLGYLAIRAVASDKRFQPYVDAVVDIARRASNGYCECCDSPGEPIVGESWLTTLCNDCLEEIATDDRGSRPICGEEDAITP